MMWARQNYGGRKHMWHLVSNGDAMCKRVMIHAGRVEYSQQTPTVGKVCKFCCNLVKATDRLV